MAGAWRTIRVFISSTFRDKSCPNCKARNSLGQLRHDSLDYRFAFMRFIRR